MHNINNFLETHQYSKDAWAIVVRLMDDEKREQVHRELAPCSLADFWARYSELDPELGEITQF